MSPNSYLTSPSLAEATISDNESFSLQSSELTTPDTPLCGAYTPLLDLEESSVSNTTTPDFDVNDKTRKYSSETENLDRAMTKANLEFDKHKNIGKEYERFEEKIIRISSENICLELKNKYENVTPEMVKVGKNSEVTPPKPEERKHKRNHQYENIPIIKPEVEPRKSNVVIETSFDSKTQDKSPANRDSIISIKYECISTESSCDSLININKTDESKLLLATVKSPSHSPVAENAEGWSDLKNVENEIIKEEEKVEISDWFAESAGESIMEKPISPEILNPSDSNWFDESSKISENTSIGDDWFVSDEPVVPKSDANLTDDNNDKSSANLQEENLTDLLPQNEDFEEKCDKISDSNNIPDIDEVFEKTENESNNVCSDEVIEHEDVKKLEEDSLVGKELISVDKNDAECKSLPPYLETELPIEEVKEEQKEKLLETSFDESNDIEVALKSLVTSPKKTQKVETKPSPKKRLSPQKSNSSGNVRQLLSKFEISPTTERDLMELKLDFDNYKKKERKFESKNHEEDFSKMMRRRNIEERPKTIERISTRRKTEKEKLELPDTNLGKSKSGSQIDDKRSESNSKIDVLLNCDLDLSDPQRRERIERYKEKRRTYLREKYHTDSFKCDKDDFVLKIKQKHINKEVEEVKPKEQVECVKRLPPFEKPARKHLPKSHISPTAEKVPEKRNPPFEKPARKNPTSKLIEPGGRDLYKRSYSVDHGKSRFDPAFSSLSREQSNGKTGFIRLGFERRSAGDFRSPKSSPEKKNSSLDFSSPE